VKKLLGNKDVAGNGISITVPKRRIFVEESNCLTHVPRVLLFHMGFVVAKQVAEKTTAVFDVGIDGCREAVKVYTVTVQLVVLLFLGL
jgi:hypothetical protein